MALTGLQGRGQRVKAEGQGTLTVREPTSSWPYACGCVLAYAYADKMADLFEV